MLKKKKTMTSDKPVMAQSVQRTRSRRMKFCVYGGLGDTLNKQRLGAEWLSRGIACQLSFIKASPALQFPQTAEHPPVGQVRTADRKG